MFHLFWNDKQGRAIQGTDFRNIATWSNETFMLKWFW